MSFVDNTHYCVLLLEGDPFSTYIYLRGVPRHSQHTTQEKECQEANSNRVRRQRQECGSMLHPLIL